MALTEMGSIIRTLLCLTLLLAACTSKPAAVEAFKAADVSSAGFGRDFSLSDSRGRMRTLKDFRGKVVLLSFGYTHCPDVCPTTLAQLADVMDRLGRDAQRVQVLFVTLDPLRDTPEKLGSYLPFFNPTFIGLWGDETSIAAVAREFHVFYQKRDIGSRSGYVLDHTAGIYAFDSAGRLRLFMGYDSPVNDIVHDVRLLLR